MNFSNEKKNEYIQNDCNLQENIDGAILIALEVLETLFTLIDIDPCACASYTEEQLKIARFRTQELLVIVERSVICLTFNDITFPYYSTLSTTAGRIGQAVEGLTLLLKSDYCKPEGEPCKTIYIFNDTLLDIQTSINNLIAVSKFLSMERSECTC